MRILLLTQWLDPEPTFKGLLFAQELQSRGHDVRVLTGFPNHPGGKVYDNYRVQMAKREVIGGVAVLRVALYPSHDGSALHRALNHGSFALSAAIAALLIRRPDVAYVHHPPATVGLPALVLRAIRGVPFIYDVRDIWPDTLAATGMLNNHGIQRVANDWMRKVFRAAARVVVPSNGFRDGIASRGVSREKIDVIHNWADETRIPTTNPGLVRAKELGFADKFNIVFAGTMGRVQGLTTVLDAADLLRNESDIQFVLVGAGIEVGNLKAEAECRRLNNVMFLPRRSIDEIGEILALADGLLVHLKDDPLFEITVPLKTQAYLMAGRPILMGVRGDAAALVREAKAGLVFEPEHPGQLVDAVLSLKKMKIADRERMEADGARFYHELLSLKIGVDRFVHAFELAELTKPRLSCSKRIIDTVVASASLVLVSVPLALLALVVRWRLGSPVLYRQTRPGLHGQPFEMIKFRSMTESNDQNGRPLPDNQRITPFGARLRSSSLDELPELWNVLRGEMSLVGPRPLLTRYTKYFTDDERLRLLVLPGITGWAQVHGRNAVSWTERLGMDAWYVRNRSLGLDLKILLMTVARVFNRSDVVVDPESAMQNLDDERRDRVVAN